MKIIEIIKESVKIKENFIILYIIFIYIYIYLH